MANQQRGEVGIEVNGKPYTLRPSLNAICEMEALTGKSLADVGALANAGQVSAYRMLIWAALQECHRAEIATLDDAGRFMQAAGLDRIDEAFRTLTLINAPPVKEGHVNGARPRKAQTERTGKPSTETRGGLPS